MPPLPAVNALLNASAAVFLVVGFLLIRRRRKAAHRNAMLASVGVSILFLVSYIVYHWHTGATRFTGIGTVRTVYFTVLVSHTILAALLPFLVAGTLLAAWRGDFARHRRRARWTLPIWLYVSVTGVVVYWMLYRLPAG